MPCTPCVLVLGVSERNLEERGGVRVELGAAIYMGSSDGLFGRLVHKY